MKTNVLSKLFERRAPDELAAFDRALDLRQAAYRELLALAERALFVRAQREGELEERRAAIARLHDRARSAARAGREEEARLYLEQKRVLREAVVEDEQDLLRARADAHEAERRLIELGGAIEALRRERRRAVAGRLAVAVDETAARPLGARLDAALHAAADDVRTRRGRLEAHRVLDAGDGDPSLSLELQALVRS